MWMYYLFKSEIKILKLTWYIDDILSFSSYILRELFLCFNLGGDIFNLKYHASLHSKYALLFFFLFLLRTYRETPPWSHITMEFKKPPDGGWGWVIVLASLFTQFLCYGSPLAVGVLYIEWLDAFGEGKGKTAWVGSLASGVGLLASKWRNLCFSSLINHLITFAALFTLCKT